MKQAISIVIPALAADESLEQALGSLAPELQRRAAGDQVLLVDDSGTGAVARALGPWGPAVELLEMPRNSGFGRALGAGIAAARHGLVFAMNSDVRVRPGFAEPLLSALDGAPGERVFAAVPRILLRGEEGRVESLVSLRLEGGIARAAQPLLEEAHFRRADEAWLAQNRNVPFPIGGACLLRRELFLDLGGFDPAFEPFYLEDLDLGWRAWRAGWCTRYVGAAVVEHRHRATIGARVPEQVVLQAIERNRLLFTWKHLDDPVLLEEHLRQLARRTAEARAAGDRVFLAALCLALEDRGKGIAARRAESAPGRSGFARQCRDTDPF
ncbi:MAG: glycosyltransferase family 2 protein [Planctomycetes bacterium]|nr:glycosyltransferase family 2 protein [Planctomycetota bacterium]